MRMRSIFLNRDLAFRGIVSFDDEVRLVRLQNRRYRIGQWLDVIFNIEHLPIRTWQLVLDAPLSHFAQRLVP